MRVAIAFAALLTFCGAAQANIAPLRDARIVTAAMDVAIANDVAGIAPETDYFRAPSYPRAKAMCGLQFRIFAKSRLADSCS